MERRPGVRELRLLNYKSIAGAILELEPLTVLVGPNGSGKSNILDAFRLLSDAMSLQLRAALDAHGGLEGVRRRVPGSRRPPRFGLAVTMDVPGGRRGHRFEVQYAFEVRAVAGHGYAISRERCYISNLDFWFDRSGDEVRHNNRIGGITWTPPKVDEHALLLPVLSGLPWFSDVRDALSSLRTYSISPRAVGDLQDPTPGTELAPDGRNTASIILEMQRSRPDDYHRLCELLNAVVPGIDHVTAVRYGTKLGLRFSQRTGPNEKPLVLDASSMSDGTLRATGILSAVFQHPSPLLIGIEEPEATLHPGALGTLMDILKIGEGRSQILITTHSPDVLDTPDLDPNALRLVRWQEGATTVSPIGQASREVLEQRIATVGELLRSNYLRPADELPSADVDLFPAIPGVSQ